MAACMDGTNRSMDAPTPHATLVDAVRHHATSGAPGSIETSGSDAGQLSYPSFWARALRCAQELHARGVQPGDRVAIDTSTSMDLMVSLVGVLAAGGVLVPLQRVRSISSHDHRMAVSAVSLSRARWCLASAGRTDVYRSVFEAAGSAATVIPLPEVAGVLSPPSPEQPVELDVNQPALIQFSSGSTSAPKGIVLTHRNVATNLAGLTGRLGLGHADRTVSWLPFSHDMGLLGCFGTTLYGGAALRVMDPWTFIRRPEQWISELSQFRATHTSSPVFGYAMVVRRLHSGLDRLARCDLSGLRAAIIGAETIAPELCDEFEDLLAPLGLQRHTLIPAYGLAENCVGVAVRTPRTPSTLRQFDRQTMLVGHPVSTTSSTGNGHPVLIGHGAPLPGTSVRVLSEAGQVLDEGEVGELYIGGQSAARSVINSSGQEHPVREDGLVPTGDLGVMVDGEVFVVGRIKEVFKHDGRIFAPPDLEAAVLAARPDGVTAAVVVAAKDSDHMAESVLVFLEARRGTTPADAAAAARLTLLREFHIRARDVFVGPPGSVPRTTSGKAKRSALAAAYLAGDIEDAYPVRRVVIEEHQQE
ncbi:nitrate ABC transporter substrate-binding protein [Longimycelium tulufanense]|uniref:Nitrate ABC transporter substrate-binding protein n=1 Tax=Longimycelium tulufanense TaxID=907463 RepID=A0A8J3FTQ6_9PSEU|nr:AMP-binding protein [Longimycelium tulufanense]GGM51186.1 nitrate ABC transporter substrate-binding protein [Longimycelium tulufanense]